MTNNVSIIHKFRAYNCSYFYKQFSLQKCKDILDKENQLSCFSWKQWFNHSTDFQGTACFNIHIYKKKGLFFSFMIIKRSITLSFKNCQRRKKCNGKENSNKDKNYGLDLATYHSQFIWILPTVGIATSFPNSGTKCHLNFVVGELVSIKFYITAICDGH